MGSGGMVVMSEGNCMVDTARYFVEFLTEESCGKCLPCRVGTVRMLEILERITEGKGTVEDLDLIKELSAAIKGHSFMRSWSSLTECCFEHTQTFRR